MHPWIFGADRWAEKSRVLYYGAPPVRQANYFITPNTGVFKAQLRYVGSQLSEFVKTNAELFNLFAEPVDCNKGMPAFNM